MRKGRATLAAEVLDFITALRATRGHHRGAGSASATTFIVERNAIPAPLNYRGLPEIHLPRRSTTWSATAFPARGSCWKATSSTSTWTVIVDGWHGDSSRMYCAGKIGVQAQKLIDVTYGGDDARYRDGAPRRHRPAISAMRSRAMPRSSASRWCAISAATASAASSTTRRPILHFGRAGTGPELKTGMFFTVEPMINARQVRREDPGGRLDRGHPRQKSFPPSSSIPWASPRPAARSSPSRSRNCTGRLI